MQFQPTLPARGATHGAALGGGRHSISTHAPRTGSDSWQTCRRGRPRNFNPRSPHGERRAAVSRPASAPSNFNPRSPHGERLAEFDLQALYQRISTHAPRTGSDPPPRCRPLSPSNFNPRSPHGERPRKATILSTRIIGFVQKVYHKTVLLRIILAENAVILSKRPQNRCEPPCKRLEACASHA